MSARALPIAARLSKSHLALLKRADEQFRYSELTGKGDGWIPVWTASEARKFDRLEPVFVETRRDGALWQYRITPAGRDALRQSR